jgi:hypothetical protein
MKVLGQITTSWLVGVTGLSLMSVISVAPAQAFSGSTTGTFGNPTPGAANPTPVFTGVGTNSFMWGEGYYSPPNALSFAGTSFSNVSSGISFTLGSLTYFNGTTLVGTTVDSVPLSINLAFSDPSGVSADFPFTFNLISTPNVNSDPLANADYVYPIQNLSSTTFPYHGLLYSLAITGFSQDGGSTSVNQFQVLEGDTAQATVYGQISQSSKVPEPSTTIGILTVTGLAAVSSLAKQKSRQLTQV